MWIIRQLLIGLRFALPQIIGLIFGGLVRSLWLVVLGVITPFKGFTKTVHDLAKYWLAEALAHGFPILWEVQLHYVLIFLATLAVISGWMIMTFTVLFTLVVAYYIMF